MVRLWWPIRQASVFGLILAGCSGDDGTPRPDPEICDDGEDNDGDGQTDCEDSEDCGGLACRETFTTDTSDTTEPALLEVQTNDCCNFTFGSPDCPQKNIGTVSITNHDPELEGRFTISCDVVGVSLQPIEWQVIGTGPQQPYLVNIPLPPESTVEIDGFFVCSAGVDQTFETVCHVVAEIEEADEEVVVDYDVSGTTTGAR